MEAFQKNLVVWKPPSPPWAFSISIIFVSEELSSVETIMDILHVRYSLHYVSEELSSVETVP